MQLFKSVWVALFAAAGDQLTLASPGTDTKRETGIVRAVVGNVEEVHEFTRIPAGDYFQIARAEKESGSVAVVRFVIPDDLMNHSYDLELRINGQCVARRAGFTSGFGLRTLFLPSGQYPAGADQKRKSTDLQLVNHAAEPLHLVEITFPSDLEEWLKQPLPENDFTLALLQKDGEPGEQLIRESADLHDAPGVQKAGSLEIYFARQSVEEIRVSLQQAADRLSSIGFKLLAIPCSWWAGTPLEVWERLDFQQVCFSPSDTHDPGEEFRAFMGERWQPGYGPTIPNIWSNTPWQTMNHPELNALRHERLRAAMEVLKADTSGSLIGYVVENEPAYWAVESSDYEYPVRRSPLWADFNPYTVEAAKRDGVILDPTAGGLSLTERIWLHQNAARYLQATTDVVTSAAGNLPVYSHALLSQLFPLEGTGRYRPYADIGRVRGAFTGLETLFEIEMDGLWRIREWGRWACVNREENDCRSLEVHLAMLRLHYMLGADIFNSYNWHTINQNNRAINYMNEFLDNLASGGIVVAASRPAGPAPEWTRIDRVSTPLEVRPEFPWVNGIRLKLKAAENAAPLTVWISQGVGGPMVFYRRVDPTEVSTTGTTSIDFGDVAQVPQNAPLTLHLESTEGWEVLVGKDGPAYELFADMHRERRRSQYVISRAGKESGQR